MHVDRPIEQDLKRPPHTDLTIRNSHNPTLARILPSWSLSSMELSFLEKQVTFVKN
jgi:hypothetical protein